MPESNVLLLIGGILTLFGMADLAVGAFLRNRTKAGSDSEQRAAGTLVDEDPRASGVPDLLFKGGAVMLVVGIALLLAAMIP